MHSDERTYSKVTTAHQAKLAYVYVRQSSLGQVLRHGESTDLQYRLVERAIYLGWPRERIQVIDEDLGKSGASTEHRRGFQHLTAEIGLGRVGLILSLDASRLARNNSDWYQLLELCSLFGTLIADGESLYDPRLYTDRLLLGLSGMMSEAELHHLKQRLHAGARHKAERGELRLPLPVGLVRQRDGEVAFHPDAEIQARIRLVFQKFRELGSAQNVVRYLRQHSLLLPSRPLLGPGPHAVLWDAASSSRVRGILRNPAYAGAYVFGRSQHDPTRRKPGRRYSGTVPLPVDKWPVLLHNVYPAYIPWEEFLAIRAQLQDNRNRAWPAQRGAPRTGQALLQGIALCGRCGVRLAVHYSGSRGQFHAYACTKALQEYTLARCQQVRGLNLDAEIEQLLLAALAPDQIALALAALEQLEQEQAALRQQWQLRLERARYEAERARRQYDAVEPEHRLVARTLEQQWEEKLRTAEKVEQAYQSWLQQNRLTLTPADRQEILALAANLPKVWSAPTTTPADRKQIVRLLIREVIVDPQRVQGKIWFQINWQTGAISEHWYTPPLWRYSDHGRMAALRQRLGELCAECKKNRKIAATLNAEGFRTVRGKVFSSAIVWQLRTLWQLPKTRGTLALPWWWEDGTYSVEGAKWVLGVSRTTIHDWLRHGHLQGCQVGRRKHWKITLTEEQIVALRASRRPWHHVSKKEAS